MIFITARKRSLGKVFTPVCHSFCSLGGGRGAYVAGGNAWQGGMHGWEHAWLGVCMGRGYVWLGACVARGMCG